MIMHLYKLLTAAVSNYINLDSHTCVMLSNLILCKHAVTTIFYFRCEHWFSRIKLYIKGGRWYSINLCRIKWFTAKKCFNSAFY